MLTPHSNTAPIKLDGENGESTSQTIKQKWNGLSNQTKYIIGGVVGGVILVAVGIFAFCCIRQRRAGKHEKLIEDAKYEKNAAEVLAYRSNMTRMRSDGMKTAQYSVTPVMGNAGATFQNHGQAQPMMGAMSPNPGYGYSQNGRGYQKY